MHRSLQTRLWGDDKVAYSIRAIVNIVPRAWLQKLQRMASGWVSLYGSKCASDFCLTISVRYTAGFIRLLAYCFRIFNVCLDYSVFGLLAYL